MTLSDNFLQYVSQRSLLHAGDRVLAAVSGGVDSMVMLDLLSRSAAELGIEVAVAHCNFSLRDAESDGDEALVEATAAKLGLRYYTVRFDTHAEADRWGESIQMAARRLRYDWFDALCVEHGYNRIAIAHHCDDSVETFFVNLMRGTGLRGLTGIADRCGMIVRPMLFVGREALTIYATEMEVNYRNDSSNNEVKYLRNRLRHEIIPLFSSSSNSFARTMEGNLEHLSQAQRFIDRRIEELRTRAIGDGDVLMLSELDSDMLDFELYELLAPYGFSSEVSSDVVRAIRAESENGRQFMAPQWVALLDRGRVVLSRREAHVFDEQIITADDPRVEWLMVGDLPNSLATPPAVAYLSADALQFPLHLRRWAAGDWFVPLGMVGQKKVSDFLIDNKVSMVDKEGQGVLVSGADTIVWLVGRRIDDRFKVTQSARKVVRITL